MYIQLLWYFYSVFISSGSVSVEPSLYGSEGSGLQTHTTSQSETMISAEFTHRYVLLHSSNTPVYLPHSGATSPTVYGISGALGGTVGSPGPKRSGSGTGNTLKVTADGPDSGSVERS